ncbi:cation diffusion facilitator family transporter [Natrarchaeobaculum sulfurireducens]|uniref:Co/Zn/Cd cation transporter n=1 Tax=Natrarchaeobaculum sulfurireducens TaxID=2044521 RepID=A0A346PJ68_9EURY|nr:cation diffusion facilitator family transporter [Natrarchaeobaculum sulfurireducens]AXR79563.1 Co/Zn/Cd cation transporter [Natrarchaeobaculum sulfurireducens]AXR83334.1 Cobalt-zinc-cadmium resistance protein [Natrarchaeobaculum sulfurireducens]
MEATGDRRRFTAAAAANVVGNAAKIAVEGAVGLAFGSVALLADAAHSVADLVGSLVVLVWGRSSFDQPDETHPHGHDRIEPLTALFVGAVLALLGLSLLFESVQRLFVFDPPAANPILLVALAFAIVDMYLVYRYTEYVNADIGSTALEALAIDCLNDIYTSMAAVVGVVGVLLGQPLLDSIAGGLVSLFVIYQGVEISRENIAYLTGAAASPKERAEITRTLYDHPNVEGVHDLTAFYDGAVLEVEVHVEVDGDMPFRRAHDVESMLVSRLRSLESVGDAHVHLDPSGIGEWKDQPEEH